MPATQLRAALGAAVLLLTILVGSPPAQATVIQVNTHNDNFLNNGDCTLREAIRAANNDAAVDACPAGAGSDVITLPRGTFTLFIFGTDDTDAAGDFDITSDVTIRGKGAGKSVVDGAGLDRVFHVPTGGSPTVRFVGLTIQDGDASFGGGIANSSSGVVTVQSSTITDNRGGQGGGLYNGNSGQLVVRDSTVTDNLGTAIA